MHGNGAGLHCGRGTIKISWNAQGQPGPSGVVSTSSVSLVKTPEPSPPEAASAASRPRSHGQAEPGHLPRQRQLHGRAERHHHRGLFPSLFVYNGPAKSDFSNDTFNVGSGALEDPNAAEVTDGDLIDSYFSGSAEITVPRRGETLYVHALGYDSDAGSGSYALDAATVTATALQVR